MGNAINSSSTAQEIYLRNSRVACVTGECDVGSKTAPQHERFVSTHEKLTAKTCERRRGRSEPLGAHNLLTYDGTSDAGEWRARDDLLSSGHSLNTHRERVSPGARATSTDI